MTSPWLNAPPVPDLQLLPLRDLIRVWRDNRSGVHGGNTVLGHAAAEEIARRVEKEQQP